MMNHADMIFNFVCVSRCDTCGNFVFFFSFFASSILLLFFFFSFLFWVKRVFSLSLPFSFSSSSFSCPCKSFGHFQTFVRFLNFVYNLRCLNVSRILHGSSYTRFVSEKSTWNRPKPDYNSTTKLSLTQNLFSSTCNPTRNRDTSTWTQSI